MRKSLLGYGHFGSGQAASNSGQSSKPHPATSATVTIPRADLDAIAKAIAAAITCECFTCQTHTEALIGALANLKGHRDAS